MLWLSAAALLSAAGFAPFNAWYLSFFGPALLLQQLSQGGRPFLKGYAFGFVFNLILVHWLAFNSGAPVYMVFISMLAAAAFLALNYGLIAWLFSYIHRRHAMWAYALFPALWTSVEFIRSFGVLGFPWISMANTQTANLLFIQMADIGGIYLVSFVLISISTLLYLLYSRQIPVKMGFISVLCLLGLPWIYGMARLNAGLDDGQKLTVRIVQPDFDSYEKWELSNRQHVFADMDSLSRAPGIDSVNIVLWPESATPLYIRSNTKYRQFLQNIVEDHHLILLTGTPDFSMSKGELSITNSLVAFEKGKGITAHYDKVHLVPFGEYIPLSYRFPALKNLNLGQANFDPGAEGQKFIVADTLALAPLICYESIFPGPPVQAVRNGAAAIVNVTNDSWFGRSLGPYQHASQAIFRAIETRRPYFRSANTGISCAIDVCGRVHGKIPLYRQAFLDASLNSSRTLSFYVLHGNLFAIIILGLSLCAFIYISLRRS